MSDFSLHVTIYKKQLQSLNCASFLKKKKIVLWHTGTLLSTTHLGPFSKHPLINRRIITKQYQQKEIKLKPHID